MIDKLRALAVGSSLALAASLAPASTPADAQVVKCNGLTATIVGTGGADVLMGTAGRDVIQGLGGNDRIFGFAGNDVICGAGGADRLAGGGGNDLLIGGDGNDVVIGGDGADRMQGNNGNDLLQGFSGNDFHNGGLGRDTCEGGWGRDLSLSCEVRKAIFRPVSLASGTITLGPSKSRTYKINLDRGDWFFLDIANKSNFGSSEFPNFDAGWTLIDSFGIPVESATLLADTSNPIKILNSGTHRLVFTAKSNKTANFTFTAYRPPVAIKALPLNRRVNGSLTVPGATARHRFTAAGGNTLDLDFANPSIDFSGRWWLVRVGRSLSESVASGQGFADKTGIRIPANGQYEVVVRGISSATPSYSFTLRR